MENRNIILIGFMGAGKTVVGQKVAQELGLKFVDADEEIEKTAGVAISEIFSKKGEACFRDLETKVLESLRDSTNLVLATGGGMVLRPENVKMLKQLGSLVLLWAEPSVIFERIINETHRPLLKVSDPKVEIAKIINYRQPIYQQAADFVVDTSGLGVDEVAEKVVNYISRRSAS